MYSEFTTRVLEIIRHIPSGTIATYGLIARVAGDPRGARQVVRVLHALSKKENLPWYRVINSKGQIVSPTPSGKEEQAVLLRSEGIEVSSNYQINLGRYLWRENR